MKLKPATRNAEVQTQPELVPACCCGSVDIEPSLCGIDDIARCFGDEHRQHIMLHHFHFHHYYHCETQQTTISTPEADNSVNPNPTNITEPTDSRPSSPLIKLSVTWPPNAAISMEGQVEEARENEEEPVQLSTVDERCADESCVMLENWTDGDTPAPVSEALRAIESVKVDTPTGQSSKLDFMANGERNDERLASVSTNTNGPEFDDDQTDQRKIFLKNINQLKRVGTFS